jgi:hypothetical protein
MADGEGVQECWYCVYPDPSPTVPFPSSDGTMDEPRTPTDSPPATDSDADSDVVFESEVSAVV